MNTRDLVVLGGGPGGLVVASVAAQLGLRVTLVEQAEQLGGDCLHYGCVPSKTLLRSARVASLMRRGAEFGLESLAPRIDMDRINAHVASVVNHIQRHDDPQRFRDYGCEVLLGQPGAFISPREVRVGERVLRARRFVIATGSQPTLPPIDGLTASNCITHRDAFSLPELPARLLVLGGGPIGVELGQAFARLGSEVDLVQRAERLLPREDAELAGLLRARLEREGMRIHTAARVERVRADAGDRQLLGADGLSLRGDELLVAAGRRPQVDGLGLDAAGVRVSARGIEVDRRLRTSQKHIFACGDVCGPHAYTHMAEYQAGIVIRNLVFRLPTRTDYRVVPRVTYCDPELAQVGLTEQQGREQGLDPEVLRFSFKDIDRALAEGESDGLIKLVTRRGRILGASLLGPHAGELIHEIVLAMQTGAKIRDLSAAIHAYPTLAQVHRRAANTAYAPRLFNPGTRTLVKWLHRLWPS